MADQVALVVDARVAERVQLDDAVNHTELVELTTRRSQVEAEVRDRNVVAARGDDDETLLGAARLALTSG